MFFVFQKAENKTELKCRVFEKKHKANSRRTDLLPPVISDYIDEN